jgi:hypothetical protein
MPALMSPKTCPHLEPERQPDQLDLEAPWEGGRSERAVLRLLGSQPAFLRGLRSPVRKESRFARRVASNRPFLARLT